MRKQDIHSAILSPHEQGFPSTEEWQMLVDKYPYFNLAHVMLAKASHDSGHLDYDQHLQMAALYTGNRKSLYDLIIGESLRRKITKVDAEIEEAELSVESNEELEVKEETPSDTEVSEEVLVDDELSTSPEVEAEQVEESESEGIAESEIEEIDSTSPKKIDLKELDEMEKEILYEAVYSTIEQEVQEDVGFDDEEQVDEVKSTSPKKEEAELSPYAQWLKQRSRAVHFIEETDSEELNPTDNADERSLIDRFIQNDPKITVKRDELYSNENLGKMSLVEDEDFVTETLAKVYARQGKINKAIKAYKKLSLKYPEKSIYFANQLKKLQNKT